MLGRDDWPACPPPCSHSGRRSAALLIGRVTQRRGRRPGLEPRLPRGRRGRGRRRRGRGDRRCAAALRRAVRLRRGHGDQPPGPLRGHRPGPAGRAGHRGERRPAGDHARRRGRAPTWSGARRAGRPRSGCPHSPGRSCWPPRPTWGPQWCCSSCCGPTRSSSPGSCPAPAPTGTTQTPARAAFGRRRRRRNGDGADTGGDGRDHDHDAGAHAATTGTASARSGWSSECTSRACFCHHW